MATLNLNFYTALVYGKSKGVPDNKSGPVSERISRKYPVRYPAGLFAMCGRILS